MKTTFIALIVILLGSCFANAETFNLDCKCYYENNETKKTKNSLCADNFLRINTNNSTITLYDYLGPPIEAIGGFDFGEADGIYYNASKENEAIKAWLYFNRYTGHFLKDIWYIYREQRIKRWYRCEKIEKKF